MAIIAMCMPILAGKKEKWQAMMERLGNHAASPLVSEVLELVDITDVLCLGNEKPNAIETLSTWGARFRSHHSGYNRKIVASR